MKSFVLYLLAFLGAVFLILIISVSVFIYRNQELLAFVPLPMRSSTIESPATESGAATVADKHPLLTETQEAMLENVGLDAAALPQRITPAMATCFEAKLGAARTAEIKAGAAPGMADLIAAQSCLSL